MLPVKGPAPSLREVTLDDKYSVERGAIYITGVQALVKLPLIIRELDQRAGLNTAGFISGYRGSPLGTFDQQLWKANRFLTDRAIRFVPGVNEELAATAVWGSQQLAFEPGAKVDGVFAMWYGKSPGVDRAMDALRHGNAAGSSANGGVLVLAGDDPFPPLCVLEICSFSAARSRLIQRPASSSPATSVLRLSKYSPTSQPCWKRRGSPSTT